MTRNAWKFAVGHLQWLPVPRSEQLDPDMREKWLTEATERARVTLIAGEEYEPLLRDRCEKVLNSAPDGEALVFFAMAEAFPTLVVMSTLSATETARTAALWSSEEDAVVSVAPLPDAGLDDAKRVVRVSRRPDGGVEFSTGFFGPVDSM